MTKRIQDSATYKALSGVPKVDLKTNLNAAMAAGRSPLAMLPEIAWLRIGPGKVSIHEYFYFQLWSKSLGMRERLRFIGKRLHYRMHSACNQGSWFATVSDKLVMQTFMRGAGMPMPELIAVIHGGRRAWQEIPTLATKEQIVSFLRQPENYPFFIKPVDGVFSIQVYSADSLDQATDELVLRDGRISVTALADELVEHIGGYLVQRRLRPHPALAEKFGPSLWSVRLVILLTPEGPVALRCALKIATGKNPADNFWRDGNMLGAIDLETGEIVRTVRGTGAAMEVNGVHPDTGQKLVGTVLPDWDALKALAGVASTFTHGLRTQCWDIALTDRGPVLLEVNWSGDLNLPQLAHGTGLFTETYVAHLRDCGYEQSKKRKKRKAG